MMSQTAPESQSPKLVIHSLPGLISFAEGLDLQERWMVELAGSPQPLAHVLLLEHRPVYTLGRMTQSIHLTGPAGGIGEGSNIEVVRVNRGGSVTYHGPGQLVAYLLLNLQAWKLGIHQHLWNLEETILVLLKCFGLEGQRREGMTGVWVREVGGAEGKGEGGKAGTDVLAKVGAVGTGCKRWVTCHGLSLNFDLDLAPFRYMDPCGLGHLPVTSLTRLLSRSIARPQIEPFLIRAFAQVLGASLSSPGL